MVTLRINYLYVFLRARWGNWWAMAANWGKRLFYASIILLVLLQDSKFLHISQALSYLYQYNQHFNVC